MKPKKLRLELESLVNKAGYTIRKERGPFTGNDCIMEGDKLVVMNTKKPIEEQLGLLARVLQKVSTGNMFIKPKIRKELEALWERIDRFEEADNSADKHGETP